MFKSIRHAYKQLNPVKGKDILTRETVPNHPHSTCNVQHAKHKALKTLKCGYGEYLRLTKGVIQVIRHSQQHAMSSLFLCMMQDGWVCMGFDTGDTRAYAVVCPVEPQEYKSHPEASLQF